jgi:hypothetical protein
LSQSQPNFAEMILRWSPFKIVFVITVLYPIWPPLLKIEISSKGQNCSILSHKVPKFELYKHNDELFNIYNGIFYELWTFTGPMREGFSRYICQVSPLSPGPMREGFSRYICQVSPLSPGPMREGFSRYICQMSRLSSGRMRGGSAGKSVKCRHYYQDLSERGDSAGTSVKCHHYHQGLWEGGSAGTSFKRRHYQGLWEGGVQSVHLSSVTLSGHMRGGCSICISFKRRHYHQGLWEGGGGSVGTSVKCHHYHQGQWEKGSAGTPSPLS